MIPRIQFINSAIYQEEIHLPEEEYNKEEYFKYVNEFIEKIKKEWELNGEDILIYIENLTNLNWKENIKCYVIKLSTFGPISDPLTISINIKSGKNVFTLEPQRFFDMLIHEIIHNFFIQNQDKLNPYFNNLIKKHKDNSLNTTIHIPVHAIHKEIYNKFFDKKRFETEIETCSYYSEYKKAWKIVLKKGSKKIIEELNSFVINNN